MSGNWFRGKTTSTPTPTAVGTEAQGNVRDISKLLTGGFDPTGQYYQQAQRQMLNATRPTMAARGLITSGPGLESDLTNLSGLNTQFAQLAQTGDIAALQAWLNAMGINTGNVGTNQPPLLTTASGAASGFGSGAYGTGMGAYGMKMAGA